MILKTAQEYNEFNGVNQSRLKLIDNPSLFVNYDKKDEEDEEDPICFKFGTFVDDLLCGEDISSKYAIMSLGKVPPEDPKKIIDKLIEMESPTYPLMKLKNHKYEIIELCKEHSVYASFKDDTRFGKILKYENYYEECRNNRGKIVISQQESELGNWYLNTLTTNPLYFSYFVSEGDIEIRTKVRIGVDLIINSECISLKGELDRLKIDHKNKTYSVIDDKTSASPYSFPYSVNKFRYDFQNSFYEYLVSESLEDLGIAGYSPDPLVYWVVMSSIYKSSPLIYAAPKHIGKNTRIENGNSKMGYEEAISKYMEHRKLGRWDLPIEMLNNGYINI